MGSGKYNAIVLGIDSVSRLNFFRQFPVTSTILKYDLKALEFVGFHIIDDDSYSNIYALLTRRSKESLRYTCLLNNTSYFDKCPIVWKYFKNNGYVTAFAEDVSLLGIFNSYFGFRKQPVDHYWNNFNLKMIDEIGHKEYEDTPLCLGVEPAHKHMLDYLKNFAISYHERASNFFGIFWSFALTYNLNYGSTGDVAFATLVSQLNISGIFNNTFLFLLSNRGSDVFSETEQGKREESLPLLQILVPDSFKQGRMEATKNMFINSKRLVTVLDLYETLKSISWNDFDTNVSPFQTRSSLFKPISTFRSCHNLDINREMCACQ